MAEEGMAHPCVKATAEKAEEVYPKVQSLVTKLKSSMTKLDQKIAQYNAVFDGYEGDWEWYKLTNTYSRAIKKLDEQWAIDAGKAADDTSEHKMQKMDWLLGDWMGMLMASQSKALMKDMQDIYDWENRGTAGQDEWVAMPPKALVYLNQIRTISGGKPGEVRDSEAAKWFKENSGIWEGSWVLPGLKDIVGEEKPTIANKNSPLGISTEIVDLVKEFQAVRDGCTEAIRKTDFSGMMERTGDYWKNKAGLLSDEEYAAKYKAADDAAKAFDKLFPSQLTGDYAEKYMFREQCFLLAKIDELAEYKKLVLEEKNPKGLPYDAGTSGFGNVNACLMADGDSYGFLNKLTQHPNQSAFFNMKTQEVANLQPMIRLFKIERDSEGNEIQRRISFDSYASKRDVENIFKEKKRRGFGVGIKDFKFTYDGVNPFAAKKSISAELTIFANNFQELLEDHRGFRYIDLAVKTGGTKMKAAAEKAKDTVAESSPACPGDAEIGKNLSKLNFRLKALVGWAVPTGQHTVGSEVMDALNDSYITLNLTPTTHEFKFDQQGRVNFNIKYLAYVEDFFDQPNFNIFTNTKINEQQIHRKLKYSYWRSTDDCGAEKIAADKKKIGEDGTIAKERSESLSTFITTMMATGRIYYIKMTPSDIMSFKRLGPYFKEGKKLEITEDAANTKNLSGKLDAALGSAMEPGKKKTSAKEIQVKVDNALTGIKNPTVGYFYVSDLIDIILASIDRNLERLPKRVGRLAADKNVSEDDVQDEVNKYMAFQQQFKKFRLLMGPLEVVGPDQTSTFVNFGDVPISLKYFMSWLTGQTLKKNQIVYTLPKFLNDLFNNLLREFLNNDDCFTYRTGQRTRLNQAAVTSYREGDLDEFTTMIRKLSLEFDPAGKKRLSRLPLSIIDGTEDQPILNTSGISRSPVKDGGVEKEINYLVYFAGRTQPTDKMKGNRAFDESRGIFHYILGKPHGIVKTIDLEKTNTKGLKEARFMSEGYDDLEQLREVYNIKIKTYANVSTFPGTYIFLDPRGFAPDMTVLDEEITDLTRFGIGGYHMITKSTSTFAAGKAETELIAKWVSQIDSDEECRQKKKAEKESSDEKAKKCQTASGQRKSASSGQKLLEKIMGFIGDGVDSIMGDNVDIPTGEENGESP